MSISNVNGDAEKLVSDEFSVLSLSQLNYNYNINHSFLDLCFSNNYIVISECDAMFNNIKW